MKYFRKIPRKHKVPNWWYVGFKKGLWYGHKHWLRKWFHTRWLHIKSIPTVIKLKYWEWKYKND